MKFFLSSNLLLTLFFLSGCQLYMDPREEPLMLVTEEEWSEMKSVKETNFEITTEPKQAPIALPGSEEIGFIDAMNQQKEKARSSWSGSGDKEDDPIWFELEKRIPETEFLGYEAYIAQAQVVAIILDGKIIDNKGQNVISYGEIVKTSTLRILSDVFKIKKPLTILRVGKKK